MGLLLRVMDNSAFHPISVGLIFGFLSLALMTPELGLPPPANLILPLAAFTGFCFSDTCSLLGM